MQIANDNEIVQKKQSMIATLHARMPQFMEIVMQGKLAECSPALDAASARLEYTRESLAEKLLEYEAMAKIGRPINELMGKATDIFGGREAGWHWVVMHAIRAKVEGVVDATIGSEVNKAFVDPKGVTGAMQFAMRRDVATAHKQLASAMVKLGGIGQMQAEGQVRLLDAEIQKFIGEELGIPQAVPGRG